MGIAVGRQVPCRHCEKLILVPGDPVNDDEDPDAEERGKAKRKKRHRQDLEPHRANTILTLSLLGFFFVVPGIIAILFASEDLRKMDEGVMDESGRSTTSTGRVCAFVALFLTALGVIIIVTLAMVAANRAAAFR